MRKVFTLLAAMALSLGVVGVASAEEHEESAHGHIKLLHVEYDAETHEPVGFKKCIDVAGGNWNSHAHHNTIHQGRAGQALQQAGHMIVPTRGEGPWATMPWSNCAEFITSMG